MLSPCKTPWAVLLCAVADEGKVLRFPDQGGATPGLRFAVTPLTPINEQLVRAASSHFYVEVGLHLQICQEFADELPGLAADAGTTLYLATLSEAAGIVAPTAWTNMPDLLRRLTGRTRVPYMRAWQILAGGLTETSKVIDAADLAKALAPDAASGITPLDD